MILVWARSTSIQMERPGLAAEIERMKSDPEYEQEEIEWWENIYEGGEQDLQHLNSRFLELRSENESRHARKQKLIDEILEFDEL